MANHFEQTWRGLASILGGLLAGIFMAVGHHLYYASLDGTPAEGDRLVLGYLISSQTLTISIGTALSFIVRALLLFAVSGAYVQVFWRAATHARKPNTLEDIDAMFSVLSNLFAFSQGSVWWKYPSLLLIALVSWLLPIAFTIPSASLSVKFTPVTSSASKTVPNFDFASLRYVDDIPAISWDTWLNANGTIQPHPVAYAYNGPSHEVRRIANSVASTGAILPITPPAPNSSWKLDFYGPSLRCNPVDDDARLAIQADIEYWAWNMTTKNFRIENHYYSKWDCETPQGYLAWSAWGDALKSSPIPNYTFGSASTHSFSFVAAMPDLNELSGNDGQLQPLRSGNMTLLQCNLRNSSYHASFTYQSGSQSIEIKTDDNEVVPTIYNFTIYDILAESPLEARIFNATIFRHLSYMAIADAYYQIIKGSVLTRGICGFVAETSIMSTVLTETPELSFLSSQNRSVIFSALTETPNRISKVARTLQGELLRTNTSRARSFYNTRNMQQGKPLQHALEEMFQNITISFLSSELLQPSATSEFAPPMPNVDITTYEPMYLYSFRQLWIAYGIAIAISTIASIFGLLAIVFSNASYSNDFSSVYRTAHSSSLGVKMRPEDMKATDPLPKYIAKAALYIAQLAPGNKQQTLLAKTAGESSETLVERGIDAAEGRDSESRVSADSNAKS